MLLAARLAPGRATRAAQSHARVPSGGALAAGAGAPASPDRASGWLAAPRAGSRGARARGPGRPAPATGAGLCPCRLPARAHMMQALNSVSSTVTAFEPRRQRPMMAALTVSAERMPQQRTP